MINKVVLNNIEAEEYEKFIINKIPTLDPGKIYYFRDFFSPERTASIRIARKLFIDAENNSIRLRLAGKYARDGYVVR